MKRLLLVVAVLAAGIAALAQVAASWYSWVKGYMPAQQMYVLRNPGDAKLSPWYRLTFGDTLRTPEYVFKKTDLKRF